MSHLAILGNLNAVHCFKIIQVPKDQSLEFDEGTATRRWLHPHLEGGYHLIEFVDEEKFSAVAWYTAERITALT
jgi:hypothetical protein